MFGPQIWLDHFNNIYQMLLSNLKTLEPLFASLRF